MSVAVIAGKSVTSNDDSEEEFYSAEQALAEFKNMSSRVRANLVRVARALAGRGNIASAEELFSEAYIRIEEGKRRWPKDVTFPRFLVGVFRSLATDRVFLTDAKQIQRLEGGYSVVSDGELLDIADDCRGSDSQRKALIEFVYAKLEAQYADDDEMRLLLMGIQDGLIGKKLQEFVGVDAQRLEALRTRLNRQVAKIGDGHRAMERQSS